MITERSHLDRLTRGIPFHPTRQRPRFWYDHSKGVVILPTGKTVDTGKLDMGILLDRIDKYCYGDNDHNAELFVQAGIHVNNRPKRQWFNEPDMWHRTTFKWDKLYGSYKRDRMRIHLYGTGNYFDDESDIHLIRSAYMRLEQLLAHTFREEFGSTPFYLYSTPASMGRVLILSCLPEGETYRVLPDVVRSFIRENNTQGRIETFSPKHEVSEIYALDGRLMYAACVDDLPIAAMRRDYVNDPYLDRNGLPLCPGFYHVVARVPDDWDHIGLLRSDEKIEPARYPNRPGETFSNWVTADELALAVRNGWYIDIDERLLWTHAHRHPQPLASFRDKLVSLRSQVDGEGEISTLLKSAIRSILLHAIGAFNQVFTLEEHFVPYADLPLSDDIAAKMYKKALPTSKGILWREKTDLPAERLKYSHPEWCMSIWGKARSKLAEMALQLPYDDIVSLRTDCIWATSLPDWLVDDGLPGTFRLKDHDPHFIEWPRSEAAMKKYIVSRNIVELEQDEDGEL